MVFFLMMTNPLENIPNIVPISQVLKKYPM